MSGLRIERLLTRRAAPRSWSATSAGRVRRALLRIGWTVKRQRGSHRTLSRPGWPDYVFAFRDGEEVGPRMLARTAHQHRFAARGSVGA
jgi:predicted RNA binding protein YcfA (HicA-like mRNA interferase family)